MILSEQSQGTIKIADEVVSIIAGLATIEVPGIAGMSGGFVGGIAEILGKRNLSKGVKVAVGETETAIDLFIITDYGVSIPDVAKQVQKNVKVAIENMTGLDVVQVNVHIQGIKLQPVAEGETASAAGRR
ncbi:MAG: Asp23/Gls24 family envelope stress response protein [Eubacteriales bacterium]|nr:Asp23/Gls24 family envelope stress response protein [Eubacteriales bacterium]MDD3073473.1 Asp23/Gls24 family envelope stress response protein [Eubacteriales bacterium]MDD4078752.1 Asp23/Gls24 family envelope stress response protein [Eubacteriales bacterium]MDD4768348.1 Asp23/Gls24 family envelope stress response protein [Eubacteriales bacterium]